MPRSTHRRHGAIGALLLVMAMVGLARTGLSAAERTAWRGEAAGIPDYRLAEQTFFAPAEAGRNARQVFAWYMPCTAVFPSWDAASVEQREANFLAEIQMAQSMGIDGFGLDIMDTNENYHRSVEAMFRAAKQLGTGFKLLFVFDYGRPSLDERAADIALLLRQYAGHEAYATVDGRPLVSAYAPDGWVTEDGKPAPAASARWWREHVTLPSRAAGRELCCVPATFRQIWSGGGQAAVDDEIAAWGDAIDGLSMWQIQLSPVGGGLTVLERQAKTLHAAGKAWMATVALQYWCGASQSVPSWYWRPGQASTPTCVNGTYFEHQGGQGLDAQWRSVLDVQRPEWVMLLTWNDYNESYIVPVDDLRRYRNGTAQAPLGWYKSMAGLDELNRYYIQWYKTGVQPTITTDTLFYAYRTHGHALAPTADPRSPVKIGNGPFADSLYLTTALTAPARVVVNSGSVQVLHQAPAGIHHYAVPFHAGRQSFSLRRDDVEIAQGEGEPIAERIEFHDYWTSTGFIRARKPAQER